MPKKFKSLDSMLVVDNSPEKAAAFINFDAEPLGDTGYQRAIAPCMEAAGHTAENLKKDKP